MKLIFQVIPQLSAVFSQGQPVLLLLILLQLYYFSITRKLQLNKNDYGLGIILNGKHRTLFLKQPMDLAGFREVFLEHEYEWSPRTNFSPVTILDLGAHIGDTALYYHSQFPKARILAVEASRETFQRLKKNVEGIDQIIPIHAAVGPVDGKTDLFIGESSLGNSIVERGSENKREEVTQMTLRNLCLKLGVSKVDLIKFDIEGAEESVFASVDPEEYADAYIGEIHTDLFEGSLDNFLNKFTNYSTEKVKLTDKRFILKAVK